MRSVILLLTGMFLLAGTTQGQVPAVKEWEKFDAELIDAKAVSAGSLRSRAESTNWQNTLIGNAAPSPFAVPPPPVSKCTYTDSPQGPSPLIASPLPTVFCGPRPGFGGPAGLIPSPMPPAIPAPQVDTAKLRKLARFPSCFLEINWA